MVENHFFIADLHLGHANVLIHDKRPFANIDEHDRALRNACVAAGRKNRTLWLLGDLANQKKHLVSFMEAVKPQWGRVMLIRGNHDDKAAWSLRDMFDEAHESRYMRVNKEVKVYLSHYAHRTWRNSHHGSYHLHGHSHGAIPRWGKSMDVGANCIDYTPICLSDCVKQLENADSINHHPNK